MPNPGRGPLTSEWEARGLSDYDRLWFCAVCGERSVVPSLARSHERTHDEQSERALKESP